MRHNYIITMSWWSTSCTPFTIEKIHADRVCKRMVQSKQPVKIINNLYSSLQEYVNWEWATNALAHRIKHYLLHMTSSKNLATCSLNIRNVSLTLCQVFPTCNTFTPDDWGAMYFSTSPCVRVLHRILFRRNDRDARGIPTIVPRGRQCNRTYSWRYSFEHRRQFACRRGC